MTTPHRDESHDIGKGYGHIRTNKSSDGVIWFDGYVETADGIVAVVYSEPVRSKNFHATLLRFVYGGRVHDRSFKAQYQPRYLVTLAKRFSSEVSQQQSS